MATALVFIAGVLMAPQADAAFSKQVQENYPPWAVRANEETAYSVELTVLPSGRVAKCRVVESVGNARLAAETCAGTIGRRLDPATDGEGRPIHGVLRTVIGMWLNSPGKAIKEFTPRPDLELAVDRLPGGENSLDLEIVLFVSPEGEVTACNGREMNNKPDPPAGYLAAACEQTKGLRTTVLQDASGAALAYVTNLRVRFES